VDGTGSVDQVGTTTATLSDTVSTDGLPTTVFYQYGLDGIYRRAPAPAIDEDQTTPTQVLAAGSQPEPITVSLTGLVPDAQYHFRLVAMNADGITDGPQQVLDTQADSSGSVPPPVIGVAVNAVVISGHVFIKPPKGKTLYPASTPPGPPEQGYVPLTELRDVPVGAIVDALHGTLSVIAADPRSRRTMAVRLTGAIFIITQEKRGSVPGLTTFTLVEGAFPGAPSYAACRVKTAVGTRSAGRVPERVRKKLSAKILQTLHAHDNHGSFRTSGKYSSATVRGTTWETIERCDGTETAVQQGEVVVEVFHPEKFVLLSAHHTYLAPA
jgi:hypothetical protein